MFEFKLFKLFLLLPWMLSFTGKETQLYTFRNYITKPIVSLNRSTILGYFLSLMKVLSLFCVTLHVIHQMVRIRIKGQDFYFFCHLLFRRLKI